MSDIIKDGGPAFPATKIAHWPNQEVPCCEKHAGGIKNIGLALGMVVSFSDAPQNSECINCKNEADKKNTMLVEREKGAKP